MFYVYVYLNPLKSSSEYEWGYEPFYVGKGKEARKDFHLFESVLNGDHNRHKVNTIRKIQRHGMQPIIKVVSEFENEQDSHDLEMSLIKKIGRADLGLGPLTNMTDGGEGTVNKVFTEEYRRKLSEGTKRALAEGRAKISDAFRFSQLGKKQSPETIRKRVEARRGYRHSPETIEKLKVARRRRVAS